MSEYTLSGIYAICATIVTIWVSTAIAIYKHDTTLFALSRGYTRGIVQGSKHVQWITPEPSCLTTQKLSNAQ